MREAESSRSAARPRAVSDAATQRSAAPVAGPANSLHLRQPGVVHAGRRERLGQAPGLGDPEVLEALEHRVLGVGGVEAASSVVRLARIERLALQGDEPLGAVALDARPPRTRRSSR